MIIATLASNIGIGAEALLAVATLVGGLIAVVYVAKNYSRSRARDSALKVANENIEGFKTLLDLSERNAKIKDEELEKSKVALASSNEEIKTLRLQIAKLESMVQGLQAIAELSSKIDKNQDLVLESIAKLKQNVATIQPPGNNYLPYPSEYQNPKQRNWPAPPIRSADPDQVDPDSI